MDPTKIADSQEQAEYCAILGNAHRIMIVWALGKRELTVSEIAEQIDSSMQNTSQHLRLMKNKGVLHSRRDGREIYYRIADTKFSQICPIFSQDS